MCSTSFRVSTKHLFDKIATWIVHYTADGNVFDQPVQQSLHEILHNHTKHNKFMRLSNVFQIMLDQVVRGLKFMGVM